MVLMARPFAERALASMGGTRKCGGERGRTADLLLAGQALFQLSYAPTILLLEQDSNLQPAG